MRRWLAACLVILTSGVVLAGPRERQVRVRRGGQSQVRVVWAAMRGGGDASFQLTAFEPIQVGEAFEIVGENGDVGRLVVDTVTPDTSLCASMIVYQAQGRISGGIDPSMMGQVFGVQAPRALDKARLVRPDIHDPSFDLRLAEGAYPEVAIDTDGNGVADLMRVSGQCPGSEQGYCSETFERTPAGAWRSVSKTSLPNCQ